MHESCSIRQTRKWPTKFIVAAFAASLMAVDASGSVSSRETSVASDTVVRSVDLFANLKACEIPGLRERLIARGPKTLAFAGEFTPTSAIPWTSGNARIFLYVISGSGHVRIGNASTPASPGDFFMIPKGRRHAVIADSAKLRAVFFEGRP